MKTIAVMLHQKEQVSLWQQVFKTQQLEIIELNPDEEMIDWLSGTKIPDLILLDLGIKSKDGNNLQASNVGRWLKENQINDRLIFVNLREENRIKDLERRWAKRQGAVDIFPRLTPEGMVEQLEIITGLLGVSLDRDGLKGIAKEEQQEQQQDQDTTSFGSLPNADAYYDRAKLRLGQNSLAGALYDIQKAIEINPKSVLYYCLGAEIQLKNGSIDLARADADIALKIDPKVAQAHYVKGLINYSLGNNQAAISDFDRAIKLNGNYGEAFNARGLAKFNSGDERGANNDYNQAIKLNPNYDLSYNNRGMMRYAQGNTDKALQDFTQALKVNPKYHDAYYNRGNVFNDRGDFAKAIEDYDRAIECNPEFARAYGNRGLAHYELDHLREALLDTQKAAELFNYQGDMASHQQALDTYRQMKS